MYILAETEDDFIGRLALEKLSQVLKQITILLFFAEKMVSMI